MLSCVIHHALVANGQGGGEEDKKTGSLGTSFFSYALPSPVKHFPYGTHVNSNLDILLITFSPKSTCQVYHGQVCDQWLNYTMLEYRWSPRFIDSRFGLNGTERVILEFMYAINRIDGQEKCKDILKALLCLYVLPPCNENNERYHYCREDCEVVFQECYSAMREMLGAAKYILEKLGIEFAHVGVPDCAKLNYSDSYKATNTTCLHWGLFGKYEIVHFRLRKL